jgi:hypothetical protein
MASLAQEAEVLKIARLLGVQPEQLAFLKKLDAATIRQLRQQATASLFDADAHLFHRVAASTRLLPAKITALIAERALGPLLCARIAGLLPADRAVDIAKRLHTLFLADVCLEIDPRHVRELIAGMPSDRVVEVACELARREEHIVMARFVDCLPQPTLRAILGALHDDAALLRIGCFVEDPIQLSAVIDLLSEKRLRNMIVAAIEGDTDLWPEALGLINNIEAPQRQRMAAIAAQLDEPLLLRMIRRTQQQELWAAMLPVFAEMRSDELLRLARLRLPDEDAVLESMIRAADAADLWTQMLPLVARMDAPLQRRAAAAAERVGADLVVRLDAGLRALASA